MSAEQIELSSPPFDSISQLCFSPTNPSHLLVSAWDTTVRLYDVQANEQKSKFDHRAAVLACCFSDATHGYSGGLDTAVMQLDFESENKQPIGQHADTISAMNWSKDTNQLVTGSWDQTVRFWDPRAGQQSSSHSLPERVYGMDTVNNMLVVAMASRIFHIFDVRNMDKALQERESSVKYMTRSVACMVDGQGYATGSVEGRIAVEYFDPSPTAQEKKYAFKCHRQTVNEIDNVWPVNALAFHPIYNTFASAGGDGSVSIWDHQLKKRLRQHKFGNSISSVAFSCDGAQLAVAVSYGWELGEEGAKGAPPPSIHIRALGDEVKPKGWSGA